MNNQDLNITNNQQSNNDFYSAASLIKWVAFAIFLMVMVISKYAVIFFASAMLPSLIAFFLDKGKHKCASATICTFNLIGVLPYLIRLWKSPSIDSLAKLVIADVNSWMIVYGAALIGQLLYISLPLLIVKLYEAKNQVKINNLAKKCELLSKEWGIKQLD